MWFTVKLIAQLTEGGSLTRNDCTEVLNVIDLKVKRKKKKDCGIHLRLPFQLTCVLLQLFLCALFTRGTQCNEA